MQGFKVLHMYGDVLDLYGDRGNIASLRYRTESRGIPFLLDTCSIGEKRKLSDYHLVFMGGGADYEQHLVSADLISRKGEFEDAIAKGTYFLLICGAYQLFGTHYVDADGNRTEGLGIGDFYTISDGGKRCIGNILIETNIDGETFELIGFENHGGQTMHVASPLGRVICGHGNCFSDAPTDSHPVRHEGYCKDHVFGTYLHGPLLPKNPVFADYLIGKSMGISLVPLDDTLERRAFEVMKRRLVRQGRGSLS